MSNFSSRGVPTVCVTGELDSDDIEQKVMRGYFSLVLFTPELLIYNTKWRRLLSNTIYSEHLKGFVIDEAHCVKKW